MYFLLDCTYLSISILWLSSSSDSKTLYGLSASLSSLVRAISLGLGSAMLIADVMPSVLKFGDDADVLVVVVVLLPLLCDAHILTLIITDNYGVYLNNEKIVAPPTTIRGPNSYCQTLTNIHWHYLGYVFVPRVPLHWRLNPELVRRNYGIQKLREKVDTKKNSLTKTRSPSDCWTISHLIFSGKRQFLEMMRARGLNNSTQLATQHYTSVKKHLKRRLRRHRRLSTIAYCAWI